MKMIYKYSGEPINISMNQWLTLVKIYYTMYMQQIA